jgi:hypothetical protein
MERQMRRLSVDVGLAPALLPAADVYETAGEFVIELEVPGYEEKELGIEVTDHTVAADDASAAWLRLHAPGWRACGTVTTISGSISAKVGCQAENRRRRSPARRPRTAPPRLE